MKIFFIVSGFLSLGIGVVGIILPVLPTTPFLILTGFLFAKGSEKYANWFKGTKLYTKYLKDFIEHKSMTRRQKWTLLILVDLMLLISFVSIQNMVIKLLIIVLVITKHIYFYKNIKVTKTN